MKKLLALLLCMVMVVSLFAACGGGDDTTGSTKGTGGNNTVPSQTDPTESTAELLESPYPKELASAEEITYTPLYHLTFDDATNLTPLVQEAKAADSTLDGATYQLVESENQILFTNGPVGSCIYLDGSYGVRLDNLVGTADDTYTISFWVNASTMADYMPSLTIGRNMGDAGDDKTVAWINVCQTSFFGTANFPTIWNRNSSIDLDGDPSVLEGVWPWINQLDDQTHGKKEWVMVTIVATGETYEHYDVDTGISEPRIGCLLYINGVEVMNGSAEGVTPLGILSTYHGLSPEILTGDGLEGYLGINYWDLCMRAYFDDLYIYDEILTPGQIASLWALGDATVETVKPEAAPDEPVEIVPTPVETIIPDENALETVGTVDRNNTFWSAFSNGYELAEGATVTVKLNNYSNCLTNWNNYVVCLTNTQTTADLAPSAANYEGYVEYAVFRADSYGWAATAFEWTNSWMDWNAWLALMADAEVTISMTRNGATVTVETTFVGADGTTMTSTAVITTTLTADAPCYFFFTGENSYIEILSVE